MVAYLKKSEGSEGFHQIVDFLNSSHINYALIENTSIYESFIKKFWQTASASTLEDGEVGITATIDGQLKTVTEASLRRHLKLEDVDDEAASTRVDVRLGGAATTVSSLDTRQGNVTYASVSTAEPSAPSTTTIKTYTRTTRGVTIREPSTRKILSPKQQIDPKNKGKGKMVESKKPLKKKDQVKADEELAKRLEEEMQAELKE
ncbi:hypothetical protein Tco_0558925 [Tanacetum coccineum]